MVRMRAIAQVLEYTEREAARALRQKQAWGQRIRARSRGWGRAWGAYLRGRYRLHGALAEWCGRVAMLFSVMTLEVARQVQGQVVRAARILLCTVASTSRMVREWDEHQDAPLRLHTVIVDECGCTSESSLALLLRFTPKNLILLGDHKQLPPSSNLPPQELQGTGHARSLLERCVLASGHVHRLAEQ